MAKGGPRLGAGRKPGSVNLKTREIAERSAAEGITPLEYLLAVMRRPYPEAASPDVVAAMDSQKLDAAKSAAPYIHPRLGSVDPPVRLPALVGTLSERGEVVAKALADGDLSPGQAGAIMQALAALARIVEVDELERRIAALESAQGVRGGAA